MSPPGWPRKGLGVQDSCGPGRLSGRGKVEAVAGVLGKVRGVPGCHSVVGEGKRRVGQSEGPGRGAQGGHSQGRCPGREVQQARQGVGGYGYSVEGHIGGAAGRGIL